MDRERNQRDEVSQAYGLLATNLNEALGETRTVLADHRGLLPGGRVERIDGLIADFAQRRVRIAVYGEVKAGKSSLINAIAGTVVSPAAFDPLTSLPIRVTYGKQATWRAGDRTFDSLEDLAESLRTGIADAEEIVIETDLDLLRLGGQVDLLDTPGVGSEDQYDAISAEVLQTLDAVVLVVRYPALFTRFTRTLRDGLEAEISKLFVVWNVDPSCAELSAEEREKQADDLRANLAGAHELFLVDARAALQARQAEDESGLETSGLPAFARALADFASSQKREIVALREAAKRAAQWLGEAERAFSRRRTALRKHVGDAEKRLRAVEERAAGELAGEAERHDAAVAECTAAGDAHRGRLEKLAEKAGKELRAAGRRWAWSGNVERLSHSVDEALERYATDVRAAEESTVEALGQALETYGASASCAARESTRIQVEHLAAEERVERAQQGRLRRTRRRLWLKWYLSGLDEIRSTAIPAALEEQRAWWEEQSRSAREAATATHETRERAIEKRKADDLGTIERESDYRSAKAELDGLENGIPVVQAARENVVRIRDEAGKLGSEQAGR